MDALDNAVSVTPMRKPTRQSTRTTSSSASGYNELRIRLPSPAYRLSALDAGCRLGVKLGHDWKLYHRFHPVCSRGRRQLADFICHDRSREQPHVNFVDNVVTSPAELLSRPKSYLISNLNAYQNTYRWPSWLQFEGWVLLYSRSFLYLARLQIFGLSSFKVFKTNLLKGWSWECLATSAHWFKHKPLLGLFSMTWPYKYEKDLHLRSAPIFIKHRSRVRLKIKFLATTLKCKPSQSFVGHHSAACIPYWEF